MSFLDCTTTFTKNSNGSCFTINMDETMTTCLMSMCNDPESWIRNAVENRCRIEGERIYKQEIEKHLDGGTLPPNSTKQSLIANHKIPETISQTGI
jgi:hypothetical protein